MNREVHAGTTAPSGGTAGASTGHAAGDDLLVVVWNRPEVRSPDNPAVERFGRLRRRPRSRPVGTDQRSPARAGLNPSETAEHIWNTSGPQWTNEERRLIYVSAGQPPLDVARPKGLEPLTF